MRVLVTGGAGFIGSHVVDLLLARGCEVAVVDDLSSGRRENLNPGAEFFKVDITRIDSLRSVFALFKPEVVTHQAAQPSLRYSLDYPNEDALVNVIGTLNVISACKQFEVKHLVFASSSAVYDPDGMTPFLEDDPLEPNLPYGIAKLAGEMYVRTLIPSHTILRYGNVYGPRQVAVGENQLVPHLLNHIRKGFEFKINGDGCQERDFVYVADIAMANWLALSRQFTGTFNAGTEESDSVNRVCVMMAEITKFAGQFDHGPRKAGEAARVALNSDRLAAFGWIPETSLWDGLRLTAEAYKGKVRCYRA